MNTSKSGDEGNSNQSVASTLSLDTQLAQQAETTRKALAEYRNTMRDDASFDSETRSKKRQQVQQAMSLYIELMKLDQIRREEGRQNNTFAARGDV